MFFMFPLRVVRLSHSTRRRTSGIEAGSFKKYPPAKRNSILFPENPCFCPVWKVAMNEAFIHSPASMGLGNNRLELMAPAGSYASLSAAIRAGADSVYFGIDKLNMRSRAASPFNMGDLRRIARICRWCGVKSYLALNVIVYDDELGIMQEVCDAAKDAKIDAVIASDISAIEYARSIGLEVHVSVQANISNLGAVRFFSRYADVMVLARELTLEQIAAIGNAIKKEDIRGPKGELVQIELFAHGALCVAISGK
jgi:putative protease